MMFSDSCPRSGCCDRRGRGPCAIPAPTGARVRVTPVTTCTCSCPIESLDGDGCSWVQNGLVAGQEADDNLQRNADAPDRDIEQLRTSLNPPRTDSNVVVSTVFQMGLAIGRITQPLHVGPTRTPDEEAKAQQALLLPGIALLVLLTGGLLGGLLWHVFLGGELVIDLAVGVGIAMIGGLTLMMFGFVVSTLVKVTSRMMRERRANR